MHGLEGHRRTPVWLHDRGPSPARQKPFLNLEQCRHLKCHFCQWSLPGIGRTIYPTLSNHMDFKQVRSSFTFPILDFWNFLGATSDASPPAPILPYLEASTAVGEQKPNLRADLDYNDKVIC